MRRLFMNKKWYRRRKRLLEIIKVGYDLDFTSRINADMTDEELFSAYVQGDMSAQDMLIRRYIRVIRACARPFFLSMYLLLS